MEFCKIILEYQKFPMFLLNNTIQTMQHLGSNKSSTDKTLPTKKP